MVDAPECSKAFATSSCAMMANSHALDGQRYIAGVHMNSRALAGCHGMDKLS